MHKLSTTIYFSREQLNRFNTEFQFNLIQCNILFSQKNNIYIYIYLISCGRPAERLGSSCCLPLNLKCLRSIQCTSHFFHLYASLRSCPMRVKMTHVTRFLTGWDLGLDHPSTNHNVVSRATNRPALFHIPSATTSTNGLRNHNWNLMKILFAVTLIRNNQSSHKFAHVTTAQLLWHVQICDLIWSLSLHVKAREIFKDLNYELLHCL